MKSDPEELVVTRHEVEKIPFLIIANEDVPHKYVAPAPKCLACKKNENDSVHIPEHKEELEDVTLLEKMARAAFDVKNADFSDEEREFFWTHKRGNPDCDYNVAIEEIQAAMKMFAESTAVVGYGIEFTDDSGRWVRAHGQMRIKQPPDSDGVRFRPLYALVDPTKESG